MSAEHLIELLHAYRESYPLESPVIERYLKFVEHHSDCFLRSQLAGHVTGSAWLVNRAGTHVLLTHEESGIQAIQALDTQLFDIDIHEIPARKNEPAHFHYDARFALQVSETDQFTPSDESHALDWVLISELAQFTDDESMIRMAGKWQMRQP